MHADAETTAEVLMECFETFVPRSVGFFDQGTHFNNKIMELLAKSFGARLRFSTACILLSNRRLESV